MKLFNCFHNLISCIFLAVIISGQLKAQDNACSYDSNAITNHLISFNSYHQNNFQDTLEVVSRPNRKSILLVSAVHGVGYVGSIAGLATIWYKDFDKTKLHAFNDMDEWGGMDKIGHANTAWQLSNFSYTTYRKAGLKQKSAALIGSGFSMLYLTTLEFFDGYSADWGFSFGDMGANLAGSTMAYFRNIGKLRNIQFKWSYYESKYPPYRPDVLGKSFHEKILKDYNGQKYWLSFNMPEKWFSQPSHNWLCFSFGYSIDGFTGGKQNYFDESILSPPDFSRVGEFYLSVDIDFSKFNIRNKFIRNILKVFNVIKIPAPAIGVNTNGKILLQPFFF